MKSKPILFSTPMVQAILAGRKTMTRRIVKEMPAPVPDGKFGQLNEIGKCAYLGTYQWQDAYGNCACRKDGIKEKYAIGDQLWVRETHLLDPPQDGTWNYYDYTDGVLHNVDAIPERFRSTSHVIYKASHENPDELRWRPSIFLPRWASRITLEITGVRVERLRDISEADAKAEGAPCELYECAGSGVAPTYRYGFSNLWRKINGADSWERNDWVWVVEFKRVAS